MKNRLNPFILLSAVFLFGVLEIRAQIGPGQAIQFDGVASQIQVSSNLMLTLDSTLTFEAWINPQKQDCNTMLSNGTGLDPATETTFDVGWNGSICGVEMKVGLSIGGWYYSKGTVPVGSWSHVAVTCDGAYVRFYINGVLDSMSPQTTSVPPTATPLYIGRQGSACNCNFFLGRMDELRIWNVARTANEISTNMHHVLQDYEFGLLAYYRFEEGNNSYILNSASSTANEFDGLPVGGPSHTNSGALFAPEAFTASAAIMDQRAVLQAAVYPGNLPTTVFFSWGKFDPNNNETPRTVLAATNWPTFLSIPLPAGLRPATYKFFVIATNAAGSSIGQLLEFALAPFTDFATQITSNSATLNGFANAPGEDTLAWFQWGTTTSYGNATSGTLLPGTAGLTSLSNSIAGLSPDWTYHFRIVSSNSTGYSYGGDVSFVTLAPSFGQWIPLANPAPGKVNHLMLLSDGTVMAKSEPNSGFSANWYRLTPDINGSYVNGTWSSLSPMHDTRYAFSSVVLRDGRLFVAGGEYGTGSGSAEVYNPLTDAWTRVAITPDLTTNLIIGDAEAEPLPDGSVMIGAVLTPTPNGTLIFYPGGNIITAGPPTLGTPLYDYYSDQDEASWVKLADDSILTIDINSTHSQRFIPSLNQWISDATVPVELHSQGEIGGAHLLPNGKALFFGAAGSGPTVIYTPSGSTNAGAWTLGPDIPNGQCSPDTPSAMMVNGKILCLFVPFDPDDPFTEQTSFYEYDYVSNRFALIPTPDGGTALAARGYSRRLLDLPDGSVLYSDFTPQLYVYKPVGAPLAQGKPGIVLVTPPPMFGITYHLQGTNLNGISVGAVMGDDNQMNSNFPLIRLTNSLGQVFYCRTFNWSDTGVMTGNKVMSTDFTLPEELPLATYGLVAVANGIASDPISMMLGEALSVGPRTGFQATGVPPGPFGPTNTLNYLLTNLGATPLNWVAGVSASWLTASPGSGALAAGDKTSVSVSLNANANLLLPGNYEATVTFTNLANGTIVRRFSLQILPRLDFSPNDDYAVSGLYGGPFFPNKIGYAITNRSTAPAAWSVGTTSSWFSVSSTGGVLAPFGFTNVEVAPGPAANALPPADYHTTFWFSNLTDGITLSHQFSLKIFLIQNGSFEDTFQPNDWTLVAGDPGFNGAVGGEPGVGHSGDFCLQLGQTNYPGVFEQIIPTKPGSLYVLSFWLLNAVSNAATPYFGVSWDGSIVYQTNNISTSFDWSYFQVVVVATNSASALRFLGQGIFESPSFALVGVDDVNLLPVTLPTLQRPVRSGGNLQLAWDAFSGVKYQLQTSTNLTLAVWQNLNGPITATNTTVLATDTIGPDKQRFYRVKLVP